MSERYPGGFITKSPPTLNPALGNAAPGIWTMDQVMQAVKNGTWPAYDPYFEYTTLLLHGNGTNGAQNNTFLDASTNNFTITRNGNATQGTFSPYGDLWSNYFDGSNGLNDTGAGLIGTSTSTFTVEAWVNLSAAPSGSADHGSLVGLDANFTTTTNYLSFGPNTSRQLRLFWFDGSNKTCTGSTTLSVGVWYHIALVVNSNAITMYVNGVAETLSGTTTLTNRSGTSGQFNIGKNGQTQFIGYASNVRISNNARTITVPTSPYTSDANTLVLACNENRSPSPATGTSAITWETIGGSIQRFSPFAPTAAYSAATIGGSGYFDGSGDSLALSSTSIDNFGTGDFTVEAWIYCTTVSTSNPVVVDQTTAQFAFGIAPSNYLYYGTSDTADILSSSTINGLQNSWRHIAISRTSGTSSLYLDGTRVATGSDSTNWSSGGLWIGRRASGAAFNGYISNVRVVKGTGLYSGATITVPTAPLTAVTNTQLLTNFTNAGIIDNAMMNDLETVGNAQISTAQSKFGGSSLYFDGTGDYLTLLSSQLLTWGTGDFTIEMWVNTSTTSVSGGASRTMWGTSSASYQGQMYLEVGTGKVVFGNTGSTFLKGSSNVADGTWHHIAVSRSGTTCRLFIDGTQETSGTNSVNYDAQAIYIGAFGPSDGYFNGYIDDLRITKGYARYTANFTPPTSQLQDQ